MNARQRRGLRRSWQRKWETLTRQWKRRAPCRIDTSAYKAWKAAPPPTIQSTQAVRMNGLWQQSPVRASLLEGLS